MQFHNIKHEFAEAIFIVLPKSYFAFEREFYPILTNTSFSIIQPHLEKFQQIYERELEKERQIQGNVFKESLYYEEMVKYSHLAVNNPFYKTPDTWGQISWHDRVSFLELMVSDLKKLQIYESYVYEPRNIMRSIFPNTVFKKEGNALFNESWMYGNTPFLHTPWSIWRYMAEVSDFIKNIKDEPYRSKVYGKQLRKIKILDRLFNDYEWDKKDVENVYKYLVGSHSELTINYEVAYKYMINIIEKYLADEIIILVTSYWE